jgi:hypothetical protein
MLFVFRTIFWLCIAMAVVPDRDTGSDFIADLGRAGSEVVSGLCMERPGDCLAGAHQAVVIGQSVMAKRSSTIDTDVTPEPAVARVPLPIARPQG